MRPISLITALLVSAALYMLVMERDTLRAFAIGSSETEAVETAAATPAKEAVENPQAEGTAASGPMRVVALPSTAREVDSAVVLRGETQAARSVEVKAETSGRVVSAPLRAGTSVAEGDALCQIDRGTRDATLAQAEAALETTKVEFN